MAHDSFVNLLVDFSLAESAASINVLNVRSGAIDSVYAFDPLKDHRVSQVRYDSSIAWYARDPEKYKQIYEEVLTKLSGLESLKKVTTADSVVKPRNVRRRLR